MLMLSVALATEIDRAPYLQSTSTSSTHVVWWTVGDSQGQVLWGPAGGDLDEVASSTTGEMHDVEITGLEAGTTYDYEVQDDLGEVLGQGSFTTNPAVGESARMRLWVIGDSGTGGQTQAVVFDTFLDATAADVPLVMLHMGDIAYFSGTHEEFSDNFFGMYAEFLDSATVWPTIGNHEAFTSHSDDQSGPYFEAFVLPTAAELGGVASGTEAYYSFDLANMHIVVLDSSDSDTDPDAAMALWLEQDLAATTQDWLIATWHHPPYSRGTHDSDTEGNLIDMREDIVPILESGGVDLVMTGHSHLYERSYLLDGAYDTPTTDAGILTQTDGALEGDGPYSKSEGLTANGGAVYVVAGHGGTNVGGAGGHPVMAFTEVDWGSVLLDIDGDHLTLRNLRYDGTFTDEFTLVKGDALLLHGPDGEVDHKPGETVPIEWTTIGDIGPVDVEWTCDGVQWELLAEDVDPAASYDWKTPRFGTRTAQVRISSGDEVDTSDAPFGIVKTTGETVIDWGATWKYSDSEGELPSDWVGNGYDDSAWPEGPGQLGFGDADEATELTAGQPTVYFRHRFTSEGQLESAKLTLLHDDGAAVWLNGAFVVLTPNVGSLDYDVYTNYASADNKVLEFVVDTDLFKTGENVMAVLVKQADAESTDLSFDLALDVELFEELPGCPFDGDDSGDSKAPDTDGDKREPYDPGCCGRGEASAAALFLVLIPLIWRRR